MSTALRTRWAAIGAACAVTLGGGTLGVVRAAQTSGERSTYVPVAPVRVLDTRTDTGAADITDATPVLLTVTGNVATTTGTATVVPVGASGVVVNVTAVSPTVNGYVSLRPGDATGQPNVSTLNVTAGGIFPNGATITLPTSGGSAGQLQIWFEGDGTGGRTDLLIDVVGYYTDHNHDDRYYTEAEVDTKIDAKADISSLARRNRPSETTTIEPFGGGGYPSGAIGMNGNPVFSYYDSTNGDLKVASCIDPACATSNITTIDSAGDVGKYTSIEIGSNGNPVVSYFDATNSDLKIALCTNTTCTSATTRSLDTTGSVGYYTSIAINRYGFPMVSYYDLTNGDLKAASCDDTQCSTATVTTLDSTGNVGPLTSMAIGSDKNPIISYVDINNSHIKTVACGAWNCSSMLNFPNTISTIESQFAGGEQPSIAIGVNGLPVISYYAFLGADLKVAACTQTTCAGTPTITTVDSTGNVGSFSSIAIGIDGNPVIVYYDTNLNVKVAQCNSRDCSSSTTRTVESDFVDTGMTLVMGVNGQPIVGYDAGNGLSVARLWWMVGGR